MLTIRQGYWLPLYFRIGLFIVMPIIVLSLFRPYATLQSSAILVGMLVLAVVAVTTQNFIQFNMRLKTYREYYWLLGFRFGPTTEFDGVEKMFINKVKLVQELNKYGPSVAMAANSEVRSVVYKCFLKFNTGEKILLDADADKDTLIRRLKKYNTAFRTHIFDTTSNEVVIIE